MRLFLKCLFLSLPFFLAGPAALANWKIAESQVGNIRNGFQLHRVSLNNAAGRVIVHMAVFDTKTHRLVVKDFGAEGPAGVGHAAHRANAVAGVNAGYFHPDNSPVGLVVSDGKVINRQERAALLSGVFAANAEKSYLLRPAEFKLGPRTLEALQAGPFLIDKGKPVAGLNNTRKARRTFVLTDGGSQWAIGICFSCTLAELAEILSSPALLPGIKIQRALNLDGGSSSGFWAKRATEPLYLRELARVRNVLLVVPK